MAPYKVKIFDFASSIVLNDPSFLDVELNGDIRWQPPEICKHRNGEAAPIDYLKVVCIQKNFSDSDIGCI